MKQILFVEDDLSLISGLTFAVKKQGYELYCGTKFRKSGCL